jgi:cation diffusion facilitator CzcD-associated flavoprotein CzcO
VQLIPEIAPVVEKLVVFQWHANYVVPQLDRPYHAVYWEHEIYSEHEGWMGALKQGTPVAAEFTAAARAHLEEGIADPELRERLWPDHPIGCRRITIADTIYPAMARDNVELVTEPPRPGRPVPNLRHERISRRPVLGGLINEYEPAA